MHNQRFTTHHFDHSTRAHAHARHHDIDADRVSIVAANILRRLVVFENEGALPS